MAIDISGIFFFMPLFSFFFVFLIVYAILVSTKILGESSFINLFVSLIMAIIFMSFSSLDLYVRTIVPWFVVLFICVFLVLLMSGMIGNGDFTKMIGTRAGWVGIVLLIAVFIIAAIKVFNPVFHPDLIITSGEGTSVVEQIRYGMDGTVFGSLILVVVAGAVAWLLTQK